MSGLLALKNTITAKIMTLDDRQSVAYMTCIYSLLGIIAMSIFGVLNIFSDPVGIVGYIEIAAAGILLFNIILFVFTRHLTQTITLFLITYLVFLNLMLISGGIANTGIFWVFSFPIGAFFLSGIRAGIWWVGALLLLICCIWFLQSQQFVITAYDNVTLRQLLVSIIVLAIGVYAYQLTRERLTSENQNSQAALEAEKIRSEFIVEHIAEGIVTTDAKGNVTFMNPTAEQLLGWKPAELIGKKFMQQVPMLDKTGAVVPPENRPLYHSLSNGELQTMNTWYRCKDGSILEVSVTGMPLIDNGKIIGAIGTFRDISEQQDLVRAKSEFITLASHQLRTPLSAVSWVSELLLNGDAGKLSDEQRQQLTIIAESNQRMSQLVSAMLAVSSLDLHTLPIFVEKINFVKLCQHVLQELGVQYADRHVQVQTHYDSKMPAYNGDPEIIKIILKNLISNAYKYTPPKGLITIKINTSSSKLRAQSRGSICITVSDTGYGIPKDAVQKIFTKFFRAKNVLRRDTDGTGLGLYIVKSLLDYIGGRVTFQSEENRGTVFTVLLPLEGMQAYKPPQALQNLKGESDHV